MSKFTMPKRVTDVVESYQKHIAEGQSAAEKVRDRNVELASELAAAEMSLTEAMDRTIADPTSANEQKETTARRKVAELRMTVSGGDERASRAFLAGTGKARELQLEAARIGKEEAERHFNDNIDRVKQAVADAKYAYLNALVDYHKLGRDAWSIWDYTNGGADASEYVKAQVGGVPRFREVTFTNHLSAPLYGIWDNEIIKAYKHGKIHRQSVGVDREIVG